MKYRWSLAPAQPAVTQVMAAEHRIAPLLAQCLLNRGLSEPEAVRSFLEPRLKQLQDPFLIPNMDRAAERLGRARERGESVVLFGDYDVDGITASTLLHQFLSDLGWKVQCFLPRRLEEGYGLSRSGAENCLAQHPATLLLAVDCGANANDTIQWLEERGVQVIVLDHHQVSDPPPPATALVNPQLAGPGSPCFRELCSVGLAFKLAHALLKQGRADNREPEIEYDIRPFLDLVALGTIADLVPLTGENRILVNAGLDRLNRTERPGLLALGKVAGIQRRITGYEVGFQLAPRLNAAGRLEDALESLHLLLAPDLASALPIARTLDTHNRQRQDIEKTIVEQVLERVRSRFDPATDLVLVEGDSNWHIGVVGIVASRVLQAFYRPTFVLGGDEAAWRGSGRSIEGFDLAQALRQCDDLLLKHGGHAMAAGLTVDPEQVPALRDRLNDIARQRLKPEHLKPTLRLDAEVTPADMTLESLHELNRLQQTGMGNPAVRLCMRQVTHQRGLMRMGSDKQHVKMWVTDGRATCEAVWWGAGQGSLPVGQFDLAFTPKLNDYQGRTTVQLQVADWQPA